MFRRKRSTDGRVIYAVGDIHGRLDLLEIMLDRIAEDAAGQASPAGMDVVFLGDYVDRGPNSRGVVERLRSLESDQAKLHFLKGNHEATMLNFLADPGIGPQWCQHGGKETLASYGVEAPISAADEDAWAAASEELEQNLPDPHRAFIHGLDLYVEIGDYLFVHAGLRPGRALDAQTEEDMLWIRDDFLGDRRRFDKIVVHGHTPQRAPVWDKRRIGLDTGAYVTGVLTSARIAEDTVAFIEARR